MHQSSTRPSSRHGSAGFASTEDLARAGLLNNGGLHHGFTREASPRQIGLNTALSAVAIGVSGSGKLATDLAYKLLSGETTIYLDPKGELFAISAGNVLEERYCFNVFGMHSGAPWFAPVHHRFNPLDIADPKLPDFSEVMSTMARNLIAKPVGGGGNSAHFWGKACQVSTAVLMSGKEDNPEFSLPDFYNVIGDIQTGAGEFFDLHINRMKQSRFTSVRQAANELESKAKIAPAEFASILSTINNAIQCLGSPAMQMGLSGKPTISISDFLKPDKVRKLFIMLPAHLLEYCGAVIRCLFTALALAQQRAPLAQVHFCLDEGGQLGNFDYLPQMYSFLRGSGGKVTTYYQNIGQLYANLGQENGETVISNAQAKLILSVSAEKSAKFVSDNILGQSTYRYICEHKYRDAAFKREQAMKQALSGGDVISAMLDIEQQNMAMQTPDAVARPLMTPDEIIHLPSNTGILDIQGMGLRPYLYLKWPYFLNKAVAHRFLPNPYHPPFDRIFIPTWYGRKAVPIISEKVPQAIAHLPQFSSGMWSYPKGFCPLKARFLRRFSR